MKIQHRGLTSLQIYFHMNTRGSHRHVTVVVGISDPEDDRLLIDSGSENSLVDSDTEKVSDHAFTGLSRGDPKELLASLREIPSLEYSLTWIQRSFNRAADDREDGKA